MKRVTILVLLACLFSFVQESWAQVAINATGNTPDNSAMLDVSSDTAGILIPRMTEAKRDAIISPATGLMIYQTNSTTGFYYFNGTSWNGINGVSINAINDLTDGKTDITSVFLGNGAGATDDGSDNRNVAIGIDALTSNTSGQNNVANGYHALFSNTTGESNSAFGYHALNYNTTGSYNTAIGSVALFGNTTGRDNLAVGGKALNSNTTGNYNTAIGYQSLQYNQTGQYNTATGHSTLFSNTLGIRNTAIGYASLNLNTTGSENTVVGYLADLNNREGSYNTIIGNEAGKGTSAHSKSGNIFLGYKAGFYETGDNKLYIENSNSATPLIYGDFDNDLIRIHGTLDINNAYQLPNVDGTSGQVLQTDGVGILGWATGTGGGGASEINNLIDASSDSSSVFLGYNAGANDDGTDNQNVGLGIGTLKTNTIGVRNTAAGYNALTSNVSGNGCVAIGYQSLNFSISGNYNTAIGTIAMHFNTSGRENTAVGGISLHANTSGNFNTAVGYMTLRTNTSGQFNTAMGHSALYANTLGIKNTAIGYESLYANTTGSENTVVGHLANLNNQEGSQNTIIGTEAGKGTASHNKEGNVFLGYKAGYFEHGDNKLYIENSGADSLNALIFGNFDIDLLRINGTLDINNAFHFPVTDGTAGQVLQTDGSGALSWTSAGGGSGVSEINDLTDGKTIGNSVFLGLGSGTNDDGTENQNVGLGIESLNTNTIGIRNTALGTFAGKNNLSGDSSVFIGWEAGFYETSSHKLYISTDKGTDLASGKTNALVYGEFDNKLLRINGTLDINNAFQFPTSDGADGQVLETNGSGVLTWTDPGIGSGLQWPDTLNQLATDYDVLQKQNISDTSTVDATRYWVGQQNYLTTALQWPDTLNQLATDYDVLQKQNISDTLTVDATRYWVEQQNYLTLALQWPDTLNELATDYDVLQKQNISDTSTVDATRYWVGQQNYLTLALQWPDTINQLATDYDVLQKQNISDTSTVDATRYWVGQQNYLTTALQWPDTINQLATDYDVLQKQNVSDTSTVDATRYWVEQQNYLTLALQWPDTLNQLATDYDVLQKQNISDTSTVDATRYWVEQQNYLTTVSIDSLTDGKTAGNSVYLGSGAGANDDEIYNSNVGVGDGALSGNTSGSYNTANGYQALYTNSTGSYNTATGHLALKLNTTGGGNVATGYNALERNTTGSFNVANGFRALAANRTGHNNTASGKFALNVNISGNNNTASGYHALQANYDGSGNTAMGSSALTRNYSGDYNSSFGYEANYWNQDGINNTMLGAFAGKGSSSHSKSGNVFIGYMSGYAEVGDNKLYIENSNSTTPLIYGEFDNDLLRVNGTLDINNAFQFPLTDGTIGQVLKTDGAGTLTWSVAGATEINELTDGKTAGNSVYLGSGAGANDDEIYNSNVGVGDGALSGNTTGSYNSANGFEALFTNSTGSNNTATGYQALYNNTTATSNTAYGYHVLYANTTGQGNTAIGSSALEDNTTGYANLAYGNRALGSNTTGAYNLGIGNNAIGLNTTGNFNTAIGQTSLYSNSGGGGNTVYGYSAAYRNESGSYNLAFGYEANYYNQNGTNNTIIGTRAGKGSSAHSKSGCVFIGHQSGYDETGDNKLYIENSNSTTPLVYGEFDNDLLRVNGTLDINNAFQFPTTDGSSGQVLQTDGAGSLSWASGGGTGATEIDNLTDGKTGGKSVFLGSGAGDSDNGTDLRNTAVGEEALNTNIGSPDNTAVGYRALYFSDGGSENTAVGSYSLTYNTLGDRNTAIGYSALLFNEDAANNTAIGHSSLRTSTNGSNNTAIGTFALDRNTTGHNNVAIGYKANSFNQTGTGNTAIGTGAGNGVFNNSMSWNVFIGYNAGHDETTDNKLYIENSNSATPLIYGKFDEDLVTIYGNLGVGDTAFGHGTQTFALFNGTVPSASVTDGVLLYSEDVSTSSELKVRDEAGNVTTLSPHNFSMINKSEPMAWSFYSENHETGQKVNVDMLKVVRLVEEVTGEKLARIEQIEGESEHPDTNEQNMGVIEQQQLEIDALAKSNQAMLKRIEKLEVLISMLSTQEEKE